jgi:acetyltransferase
MTQGQSGFSLFASTGNKAVLEETRLLEYLVGDEDTRAIAFYSEDIRDGLGLRRAGRLAAENNIPVTVLKSGQTEAGSRASSSHTGSLAGSDRAYDALFKQSFIHRARTFQELEELLAYYQNNPLPEGPRVGIVTNAGGIGVLATDRLSEAGLTVATLSEALRARLAQVLPPAGSTQNPVDLLGDAPKERYRDALDILGASDEVDMLLVILTPQSMTDALGTARVVQDFRSRSKLPVIVVLSGGATFDPARDALSASGISYTRYAESAAATLGIAWKQKEMQARAGKPVASLPSLPGAREKAEKIIGKRSPANRLSEDEARQVLEAYGFRFPETRLADSLENALRAAEELPSPFVLKIVSPDIVHKSDVGGVRLSVTRESLPREYRALMQAVHAKAPHARLEGVMLAEMAPPGGHEFILGLKNEPGLGKLVMCGLGGIYVETLRDVAFRLAPLSKDDAQDLLSELKSRALFSGARGQKALSQDAVIEALGRLSQIAQDFPEIEELDINPLVLSADTAPLALDARISF